MLSSRLGWLLWWLPPRRMDSHCWWNHTFRWSCQKVALLTYQFRAKIIKIVVLSNPSERCWLGSARIDFPPILAFLMKIRCSVLAYYFSDIVVKILILFEKGFGLCKSTWQGNAFGLNVRCPKLNIVSAMKYSRDRYSKTCHKKMHLSQMHIGWMPTEFAHTRFWSNSFNGYRGVQRPNEVWAQRLQNV